MSKSIDELLKELNERGKKVEDLRKERDAALDALTISQEEWFLRTKNLEVQNYELKKAIEFVYAHLKNMDNYSLVESARYVLLDALKGKK